MSNPLLMNEAETVKVLDAISRALWGAQMETADEICYGSLEATRKAGEEERRIERVLNALPKRVKDAYNRRQRKAEADKLRAKAKQIEAGR